MDNDTNEHSEIIILGAGLVGSLLGIALSQIGHQVIVFEKRPDPRNFNNAEGRSINLALSDRGIKALQIAGLNDLVLQEAVPMKGRMVHEKDGSRHFHAYSEDGKMIYSVSRAGLNKLLVEEAERKGVNVIFGHTCKKIFLNNKMVELESWEDRQLRQFSYDILFGADGAFSSLRKQMMGYNGFNYSQQYLDYGYKELNIPATPGYGFLDPNALHIWPRKDFMLIALPNKDGSFTCTLFLPFEGEISFTSLSTNEKLNLFFDEYFPDIRPFMPELEKEFFEWAASSMVTIQCDPWVFGSEIALIGDAAHAILPFYGQGMNAGFEDITLLLTMIQEGTGIRDALEKFNKSRKHDTDAIAHLALHNFLEMRDLVSDPSFILRKKIEGEIHKQFPSYASLYSMVTFSDLPYSFALEKSKLQDKMFEEILGLSNVSEEWKHENLWSSIEEIFKRYFPEEAVKSGIHSV